MWSGIVESHSSRLLVARDADRVVGFVRFYKRVGFLAEPESRRQFEIGGAAVEEVRFVFRVTGQHEDWRSFTQLRERLGPTPKDLLAPRKQDKQPRDPFKDWTE